MFMRLLSRDHEPEMLRQFQTSYELCLGAGYYLHHFAFGAAARLAPEHVHPYLVPVQPFGYGV